MSQERASGISRNARASPRSTRSSPPALIRYSTTASRFFGTVMRALPSAGRLRAHRPPAATARSTSSVRRAHSSQVDGVRARTVGPGRRRAARSASGSAKSICASGGTPSSSKTGRREVTTFLRNSTAASSTGIPNPS